MIKRVISSDFQSPEVGNGIVAIFQCPTQKEVDVGIPVAGVTGENLDFLLQMIRTDMKGADYLSWFRSSIMIVNVSSTEKSLKESMGEARNAEIAGKIYERIKNQQVVLCFGKVAYTAVEKIKKVVKDYNPSKIIAVYHLSPKALNLIIKTEDGDLIDNRLDLCPRMYRLRLLANYIRQCYSDDNHCHSFSDFSKYIRDKLNTARKGA